MRSGRVLLMLSCCKPRFGQVMIENSVPPVITPLKPKVWLLCTCDIAAQTAVKLF